MANLLAALTHFSNELTRQIFLPRRSSGSPIFIICLNPTARVVPRYDSAFVDYLLLCIAGTGILIKFHIAVKYCYVEDIVFKILRSWVGHYSRISTYREAMETPIPGSEPKATRVRPPAISFVSTKGYLYAVCLARLELRLRNYGI
jgi:hypothetical protein